jgi:hypothetical protein
VGYRSDVTLIIRPTAATPADFFATFAAERPTAAAVIAGTADFSITTNTCRYVSVDRKWYDGNPDVNEVNALVDWANNRSDNDGMFIVIGEEVNDVQETWWGENGGTLAWVTRSATINVE